MVAPGCNYTLVDKRSNYFTSDIIYCFSKGLVFVIETDLNL
jgi:hypothetical protein